MAKYYDPSIDQFDCPPTIMTATFRGKEFRGEGIGEYDDAWPEGGRAHPDAFNSAWESIAAQLPDGQAGDVVDLTNDDIFNGGSLHWVADRWEYDPR